MHRMLALSGAGDTLSFIKWQLWSGDQHAQVNAVECSIRVHLQLWACCQASLGGKLRAAPMHMPDDHYI